MSQTEKEIKLLRRIPIFSDYDDATIQNDVLPHLSHAPMKEGQIICRERAAGDSCFFLVDGEVDVRITLASGKVETIAVLDAGVIFGQVVLLDGGPRSATCVASTNGELFELTRSDFEALRARNSPMAFDLQVQIARSLGAQVRQATNNLSAMSETRVEDPAAISQRLEAFLTGKLLQDDDEGPKLKLKDVEL